MKALRLVAPHRPVELHDVPTPVPGPDDVLIRVHAAGICHSDAHYRNGVGNFDGLLPLTLGHEVAGTIAELGTNVHTLAPGQRVCVHYLATCGACAWCAGGHEQFCNTGRMMGRHRDGGMAEFVVMPAASVFALPDTIPFAHGAVMMCSSATALHALRKARLAPGETVAVFGVGGLGASAVQLARALGAGRVFAVEINADKLALAEQFGATPVNARTSDAVAEIRRATGGRGADVALELVGLPQTMQQAVRVLNKMGRAALAGLTRQPLAVDPYYEVINQEAEIIGVSDHLATEIPELLRFAADGRLRLDPIVTRRVPLDAGAINHVLDDLDRFGSATRTVVQVI